jgi:putative ABC transport system substrate-binding protein
VAPDILAFLLAGIASAFWLRRACGPIRISISPQKDVAGRDDETSMMLRAVGIIVSLVLGILMTPLADAQRSANIPRIGVLLPAEPPSPEDPNLAAFRHALEHLGYVDGQTVAMEYRYALGKVERIPELVAKLVRLQVDILVVGSAAAAGAAKDATQVVPIFFAGGSDPVGSGLVASLAQPGGNLT